MRNCLGRFHLIEIRPVEILDLVTLGANQVVMTGKIYVKPRGVVDMMNPLNQPGFLKQRDGPIDGIERDGLQLLADLFEDIFYRRMVAVFEQSLEDLHPLMRDPESLSPTDSLKAVQQPRFFGPD